jgi:hypothetical protein
MLASRLFAYLAPLLVLLLLHLPSSSAAVGAGGVVAWEKSTGDEVRQIESNCRSFVQL